MNPSQSETFGADRENGLRFYTRLVEEKVVKHLWEHRMETCQSALTCVLSIPAMKTQSPVYVEAPKLQTESCDPLKRPTMYHIGSRHKYAHALNDLHKFNRCQGFLTIAVRQKNLQVAVLSLSKTRVVLLKSYLRSIFHV